MKKLLYGLLSLGTCISPITSAVVSCGKDKADNSSSNNEVTPSDKDEDMLINNSITNYWTARSFISNKYNTSLTEFSLDWINNSTLRLRPNHGTTFEKVETNLIDLKIDTGFNDQGTSSKLSEFSTMIGPITGEKIILPYNVTLSGSDDTKDEANEGYFQALQLISGIKLDSSKYTYSFESKTSTDDESLKGTFTITNKSDNSDTVTIDVKSHAISFDQFYDNDETAGPVFLPDEIKSVTSDDFSMFAAMQPKSPTLMAFVNKYRVIDWQDDALKYYQKDLETYYTKITMGGLNEKAILIDKDYSDDSSSGKLSFKTTYVDEFNQNDFKDIGILKEDANGYVTDTVINFKSEDEIKDIFFAYPNTIVKGENGQATYKEGKCTTDPVDGLIDVSTTDETYKNDEDINVFGNCYQFNNWSISSSTTDELSIKKEFVKELYDVTGFEVPDDQYLYNDVKLKIDGDSVYAYLSRYSNIYNNNVYKVMYYPGIGFGIASMDMYEGYDKTTGSYCFKLTQ